ncbi:DUF2877 domain-containing protein [Pasteurella testudinis]|uniref:DUF2877 domain-containing protein n=1 Tax=Pasteurella testudinis TaxID=761 RepID=UPI004059723F
MLKVKALSSDIETYCEFSNKRSLLKIHSQFKNAINFQSSLDNLLLTLVSCHIENAPGIIRVNVKNFDDKDPMEILNNIDMSELIFTEDKLNSKLSLDYDFKIKIASILFSYIQQKNTSLFISSGNSEIENKISTQLFNLTFRINQDIQNNRLVDFQEVIHNLIGLGIGLTPSGDDFLTGFLAVLFSNRKPNQHIIDIIRKVIEGNYHKTTKVSSTMLHYACLGHFHHSIIKFLNKLQYPDKDFNREIKTILNIGSSSGSDLLFGIFKALSIK